MFSSFLANAYELKSVADYGVQPESITAEAAATTIVIAERLIGAIVRLLGSGATR